MLAFPAQFVVAGPVTAGWLTARLPDSLLRSPLAPRVLVTLADLLGVPAGESDAVLVATPLTEQPPVPLRPLTRRRATPGWFGLTPGNAHSLRAVLAAGYRPVGQEVLFPLRPG